jgi:hypothetical protein
MPAIAQVGQTVPQLFHLLNGEDVGLNLGLKPWRHVAPLVIVRIVNFTSETSPKK